MVQQGRFADIGSPHDSDIAATPWRVSGHAVTCLLYTSDAADERSSVDLGGRRIIKKKKEVHILYHRELKKKKVRKHTAKKERRKKRHET